MKLLSQLPTNSLCCTALLLAALAWQNAVFAQTAAPSVAGVPELAKPPKPATASAATQSQSQSCEPAKTMLAERLFGHWKVVFTNPPTGLPTQAVMHLERHAQFSESLAGTLSRELGAAKGSPAIAGHAALALLAGDLDEGLLLLDESSDKISITGTWNGAMLAGSCGQQFQGLWQDTSSSATPNSQGVPFTLTRLP